MAELPGDLDEARHLELEGRARHSWYRRVLFGLICVLPVLGLLNLFGQHPSDSRASGPAATLELSAPRTLRGGLMWQARVTVTALRDIGNPQLTLSPGMLEEDTENSTNPQPMSESTSNGRVTLSYQPIHAGRKLTVWLDFQVNPINVGRRDADVLLTDGATPLAHIDRKITFLP